MKQKSWKSLTKKPLTGSEKSDLYNRMAKMEDRAAALVAHSFLERGLERAIASRLKVLSRAEFNGLFDGPLNSFVAKVKFGYALNLYGQEASKELFKINDVRNVFAHSVHNVTFNTKRIIEYVKTIKTHKSNYQSIIYYLLTGFEDVKSIDDILLDDSSAKILSKNPKLIYLYSCTVIYSALSEYRDRPKRPAPKSRRPWVNYFLS